jgi:hypothetical protein
MEPYHYPTEEDYYLQEEETPPKLSRMGGMIIDVCSKCRRCKSNGFYYSNTIEGLKKQLASINECISACERCDDTDPDLMKMDEKIVSTRKELYSPRKIDYILPSDEEEEEGFHVKRVPPRN